MNQDVERTMQALYAAIQEQDGRWVAQHQGLRISSQFQPIYSLPHRSPVGYEALARFALPTGEVLDPARVFARGASEDEQLQLDRLCRLLHVHNFVTQAVPNCWLFLNIHPEVFVRAAREAPMLARAVNTVEQLGLPMHRLVFEVTEEIMSQGALFEEAVERARATGCLLALDDFGAGHSNFDRVWRMKPEIVKLDKSLPRRALASPRIARIMAQMVALLHECGALVLQEGIEGRDDMQLALDADVDLLQGFGLGRPAPDLLEPQANPTIDGFWDLIEDRQMLGRERDDERLQPFRHAVLGAMARLQAGERLDQACQGFLAIKGAQLCFLLDEHGHDLGMRVHPDVQQDRPDLRFAPLDASGDARWSRRPYFRRAMASVGELQVTRPYLSLHGARMCVTLSLAFWQDARLRVLCADVDWGESDERGLDRPRPGAR
ncbi:sensor domain-containing phosphodiesterase [Roseateles sp. DB2]|uniref:EAL domain-containing protein n=1 Tax=Roseateles sp. DB2 TaxID=3453717 RepID=UPI003EEF415F